MSNPTWRVALVALALCLGTALPAVAAGTSPPAPAEDPGGIGIRLLDAPTSAKDDPRARVYIVDHLAPGAVIKRRVEVTNSTKAAVKMALYPAAASLTKGSFVGADARTANELSTWTTVTPAAPEVPAGSKATAMVTITVPKDAAPGEQYGVIWAEARSAAKAGAGVVQVSRVGVRLYVSVGPGGPPPANFTIDTMTAQRAANGQPMVVASVHNTGGRAMDMSGALELTKGPGGLSAGPFPANVGVTLAVGADAKVTIALDKALPAGPWQATIKLRSGLVERATSATLTFPATGAADPVATKPAEPASGGVPTWAYLAAAALAAALTAAAAAVTITRRRRLSPTSAVSKHHQPIG